MSASNNIITCARRGYLEGVVKSVEANSKALNAQDRVRYVIYDTVYRHADNYPF